MRGSLVHDALYQLMREGFLDKEVCRALADRLLQVMCIKDGMSCIRSWWVHKGLRIGGGPASNSDNKKLITMAPEE